MSNPVFLKTELMKGSPNPNFNLRRNGNQAGV